MKQTKILLAALALVCATVAANAQAQFALGIKAGPNFANLDTESSIGANYKNRTGFHGGAFALLKLTKIGIQPEILFSQQGSTVRYDNRDFHSNYSYFNVPVILKLYTIAGINLQAGPQFGFLTKATREDFLTGVEEDVKGRLKSSDVSLALGAGWDLPFGITIDARYNLGLSKLSEQSELEARNQVWQFSLGYKFIKLGK